MKYTVLLSVLIFSISAAAEYKQQWVPAPDRMLFTLIFDSDGVIMGTDALLWPDGRSAMIRYIKIKDSFYRFVDYRSAILFRNRKFLLETKKVTTIQ